MVVTASQFRSSIQHPAADSSHDVDAHSIQFKCIVFKMCCCFQCYHWRPASINSNEGVLSKEIRFLQHFFFHLLLVLFQEMNWIRSKNLKKNDNKCQEGLFSKSNWIGQQIISLIPSFINDGVGVFIELPLPGGRFYFTEWVNEWIKCSMYNVYFKYRLTLGSIEAFN